jgi:hypothetical protein
MVRLDQWADNDEKTRKPEKKIGVRNDKEAIEDGMKQTWGKRGKQWGSEWNYEEAEKLDEEKNIKITKC